MMDVYSMGAERPTISPIHFRQAGRDAIRAALSASRATLLSRLADYRAALGDQLLVPYAAELNPPLWEVGHIAWFEEFWIARNPERAAGRRASAETARLPSLRPEADACYNSSQVPHASRWHLPLPDLAATLDYLAAVREGTLAGLDAMSDAELYFVQLAILHEDMHGEAWAYMAQTLGLPLQLPMPPPVAAGAGEIELPGGDWLLGCAEAGFAFDNELPPGPVCLVPFAIDAEVVSWRRYLPFIAADGYGRPEFWSKNGNSWRQAQIAEWGVALPRYLRPVGEGWEIQRFGRWQALDPDQPAIHLTHFEAEAWCRWAGPSSSAGAASGNGRPAPSPPSSASRPIPTPTTRGRGSTVGRCCAAPRLRPASACATRATATSSPPNATTFSPASAAAPARLNQRPGRSSSCRPRPFRSSRSAGAAAGGAGRGASMRGAAAGGGAMSRTGAGMRTSGAGRGIS
jgi:gamma-glutamyl hercynylcysteine S-oxide synthase